MQTWLVQQDRLLQYRWPPYVWRVLTLRAVRSFSLGYMNILVPLYLMQLGLSAKQIGFVISGSFAMGAILLFPFAWYATHYSKRHVVVGFAVVFGLTGAVYAWASNLGLLIAISILAGIGRGGAGGAGQGNPTGPVEQTMLADLSLGPFRRSVFLWDSLLTTACMGGGALLSGVVKVGALSGAGETMRLLFLTVPVTSAITAWLIWALPERQLEWEAKASLAVKIKRIRLPRLRVHRQTGGRLVSRWSMSGAALRFALKQSMSETMNTFGLGLVNSLFVIWLHVRFHVGAHEIGVLFATMYLMQVVGIVAVAVFLREVGSVVVVIAMRVSAAVIVCLMALAPSLWIAGCLQVARTMLISVSNPLRRSFMFDQVSSTERTQTATMISFMRRIPASVSPTISGALITSGFTELPLYVSGLFQFVSAYLYFRYFWALDE